MAKFVRVATAGKTIDGRNIAAEILNQAAENYDPEKYGARINLDHIRSIHPESAFKSYGDVVALKTEKIDGETVLLAELDPTADLIALNKERQKVYSSVELTPDFKGTGEWYLTGLAVTDSPASTGTEMLKFSAAKEKSLLSSYSEIDDLTGDEDDDEEEDAKPAGPSILARVKKMLSKKDDADGEKIGQAESAILHLTEEIGSTSDLVTKLTKQLKAEKTERTDLAAEHEKLAKEFAALKASLEGEASGGARPENTGGDGVKTDC